MKFLQNIKLLDIIGKEIQFKIENSETYKTALGGFLTILLGVISLISLWFFGNDIIYKTNPQFLSKDLYLDEYEFHVLNNTNFFFAIRFTDYDGLFIEDPRFLVPKFKYEYYVLNDETGELEPKVSDYYEITTKCSVEHIDNETLQSEILWTYWCVDLKNLTIGGDWSASILGSMSYIAEVCNENTEKEKNITCASAQEITDTYNDLMYMDQKWHNAIIDPSNFTHPVKRTLNYKYQLIDGQFRKENKYFWVNSQIQTDEGIVFEELKNETLFQSDTITFDVGKISKTEHVAIESNVGFLKLKKEYLRTYIKVQDVAATVGGFFSLSFYVLKIIYYFYIQIHLQFYYYEQLLDFRFDKNNDESTTKTISKINVSELVTIIPFNKASEKNIITNNQSPENEEVLDNNGKRKKSLTTKLKDVPLAIRKDNLTGQSNSKMTKVTNPTHDLAGLITHHKVKRESYQITFCNLCLYRYFFCFYSEKDKANSRLRNQLIYQAEYEIDKRVDTLKILQIFEQFKILKKLFLNENQCYMLDNKGKQTIYNKKISSKHDFSRVIEEKRTKMDKDLIRYLNERKQNNQINEIDSLLFNLMDEELKLVVNEKVSMD